MAERLNTAIEVQNLYPEDVLNEVREAANKAGTTVQAVLSVHRQVGERGFNQRALDMSFPAEVLEAYEQVAELLKQADHKTPRKNSFAQLRNESSAGTNRMNEQGQLIEGNNN
jgi:hypothetical protein